MDFCSKGREKKGETGIPQITKRRDEKEEYVVELKRMGWELIDLEGWRVPSKGTGKTTAFIP